MLQRTKVQRKYKLFYAQYLCGSVAMFPIFPLAQFSFWFRFSQVDGFRIPKSEIKNKMPNNINVIFADKIKVPSRLFKPNKLEITEARKNINDQDNIDQDNIVIDLSFGYGYDVNKALYLNSSLKKQFHRFPGTAVSGGVICNPF